MNDLLKVIAELPANVRYALYGAGRYAARCLEGVSLQQLQEHGRKLVGIIDDYPGVKLIEGVKEGPLLNALASWKLDWIVLSTETLQYAQMAKIEQARLDGLVPSGLQISNVPPMEYADEAFADWQKMRDPDNYFSWLKRPLAVMDQYLGGHEGKTALDFGCGQFYPMTLLMADAGVDATGVDVVPMITDRFAFNHWQSWMVGRMEASIERLLPVESVKVVRYDGERLPFDDCTFDFVHSNSVFEHLPDVEGSLRELQRVMKPDGVAWISIHYFPSIAGYHPTDKPYYYLDPLALPPNERLWPHLRDDDFPIPEDLNRRHEADFIRAIAECFETLEYVTFLRGDDFLTPELENELAERGYSRQEALTHVGQFVLRPKKTKP